MSLFPAYAAGETSSVAPNLLNAASPSGNFDWLKSINSAAENANRDTLLFPTFTADDDDKRTCEVNEINKDEDSYKSRKSAKHAKRKKKLEAKAEAEKERILTSSSSKRIFTDQFDSAGSLKQTYRIDKKCDRTNLAFTSLAPAQVAKYYRKRPLVRDNDAKSYSQTRVKRYFQQNFSEKNRSSAVRRKFDWETQRTSYFLPLLSSERDDDKEAEDEVKSKRDEWNQRVREKPHDVRLWLDFLRSQSDTVITDGFTSSSDGSREKVVFERQLAIVERALEHNPKARELWLYKLELCKEVWESDRLAKEWKQLLFLHPNDVALHQQYLIFFQTKFSNFTVSKFVRLAGKCFATFNKVLEGVLQSHPAPPNMEEQVLSVFFNYCSVLVGSGHQEKAVANYQALIEFNLFAPDNFSPNSNASLQDKLAFFEPFWDSGLPRFGQPNASGWANVMKERHLDQAQTYNQSERNEEEEDAALKCSELQWRNWLRLERLRMRDYWFPGESEEDPERDVLLDDVAPTLFTLRRPSNHLLLVLHFLSLFGVELEPDDVGGDWYAYLSDVKVGRRQFPWRFYRQERCTNSIPLQPAFPRKHTLDSEVIDRVFRGVLNLFQGSERKSLTLLWMRHKMTELREFKGGAKETQNKVKEVKKFMKWLLGSEENRNDYLLLTLYAQFLLEFASIEQAKGVFRLLTTTQQQQPCKRIEDGVSAAYAEYALFCLETNDLSSELMGALETFLKGNLSSKVLRMAKGGVLSGFDEDWMLVRKQDTEEVPLEVQGALFTCLAVYGYMRGGAKEAEAILSKASRGVEEEKKASHSEGLGELQNQELVRKYNNLLESLYSTWIRVLVAVSEREPASSFKRLKAAVSEALRLFSSSPSFNHLFLDTEAGSHLSRTLRRHYGGLLKESCKEAGMVSALFALLGELERARNMVEAQRANGIEVYESGGITHRLRALFETILRHSNLKHSVVLWRLYLHFEAVQGQWMKCKAVVYRAFKHCPWAKVLFLDAVELLPEDVEELSALMTEKEIRTMAPIEEVQVLLNIKAKLENKIACNENQEKIASMEEQENVT